MNEKEAINVLIQAAVIGQRAGAYTLKDASLVYAAITKLSPEFFNNENAAEEEKQENKEN